MVNRYLKVKAEQKEKKRVFGGLMKKSNVVAIMMEDSHLYIAKNKVAQLTVEQKLKLKELLSSLLELTFDV
jgi:translation initiation factor RLI1